MTLSVHPSVHAWLTVITAAQTVLLAVGMILAWTSERTYPAMRLYLLADTVASLLFCALQANWTSLGPHRIEIASGLFWGSYAICGLLTFLAAQQIFRDALSPAPELRRVALVAFRWVALISVALSVVPAIVPLFFTGHSIELSALQAMRCVSVLEFCLAAFILLSAQALGITLRSRIMGITLGFGILAIVDTVCFLFLLREGTLLLPWLLVRETGATIAALIWLIWLLRPEPVRGPVLVHHQSQLYKWNEIAMAISKPAPHIAMGQPPPSAFFLRDVEGVVDRVLSRNNQPPAAS